MKHNIRINGQVQEFDCEIGSGKLDKNGREILEGDRIRTSETTGVVTFYNAEFLIEYDNLNGFGDALNDLKSCELEIIDD